MTPNPFPGELVDIEPASPKCEDAVHVLADWIGREDADWVQCERDRDHAGHHKARLPVDCYDQAGDPLDPVLIVWGGDG